MNKRRQRYVWTADQIVVKPLKKATKSQWALHPVHELHDKIVEAYSEQLAQAFKDSVHGIHEAVAVAQRHHASAQKATGDPQDAVESNVTFDTNKVADVLRNMLGDAYLAGSHVAAGQIGGGAKVLESLEGAATGMDWSAWKPGWLQAAGTVRDSGLQALLAQRDADIKGITDTMKTRIGNVLADGISAGDSVDTIAANMSDMAMSSDRALVIANTEVNAAMTQATLATYDQNGVDQYEWLAEDDACPECDALNGQTFDVGSGDEQPPEHPSCFPAGTVTSGSRIVGSTSRWFDGQLIEIGTAAGELLSVTPNHPILTDQGWIAAGLLNEGSNVIRCIDVERVVLFVDPDNYYGPSLIEDVAETLGGASRVITTRMPSSTVDFHGDGLDGQVNIVRTNGLLGLHDETLATQHANHFIFPTPHVVVTNDLISNGDLDTFVQGRSSTPSGVMSGLSKTHTLVGVGVGHSDEHGVANTSWFDAKFNKTTTDHATSNAKFNRECLFGFPVDVSFNDAIGDVNPLTMGGDSAASEFSAQRTSGHASDVGSLLKSLSGLVECDRIVHLRRIDFSGQVYNLQTATGWYVANGIIAHNCRCTILPVVSGQDNAQPTLDSGGDS